AINCTIDSASSSSRCLELIVQQANRQDLDWFISIHLNAGKGRGVEVYTYKGRQYEDALNVCKNIANLGFTNRGVKDGTGLYVIKKTKAKSMLIEVCFCDSDDIDRYNQLSYTDIAKAIVDGVIGAIENPVQPVTPQEPFNEEWYAKMNPDVVEAKMDLYAHYINWGKAEGRSPIPKCPSDWDESGYLMCNPDVNANVSTGEGFRNGRHHWEVDGWKQDRKYHYTQQVGGISEEECQARIIKAKDELKGSLLIDIENLLR
ncbi:MAG: N-acetylmuramoyl-L-alanine amidase, partial [Clostridium sp.]